MIFIAKVNQGFVIGSRSPSTILFHQYLHYENEIKIIFCSLNAALNYKKSIFCFTFILY